jgi:uncharacterized membrane protein (DUF2068 family)
VDWSLLGCARGGHITYAPDDDPVLRARLAVPAAAGEAWRCLRCGAFVPGEPAATGPASAAPVVPRGNELRSAFILRFFAVERFVRTILAGVAAYLVWRFKYSRVSFEQAFNRELPAARSLLRDFGYNIDHSKLLGLIQHAFTLNQRTLTWIALLLAAYALIELIEAVGLWLVKRWGEYFAMVATSAGLPLEIYELAHKITVLRVVAFVINLALVVYLVVTKRLFGVRGGRAAYEAKRRTASILESELDAIQDSERGTRGGGPGEPAAPVPAEAGRRPAVVGETVASEPVVGETVASEQRASG